jgi:hypothetical protein
MKSGKKKKIHLSFGETYRLLLHGKKCYFLLGLLTGTEDKAECPPKSWLLPDYMASYPRRQYSPYSPL